MKELIRRRLRTVAALIVRLRSKPYRPTTGCRCVVIAPHQDDEAFGCGGLILTLRTAEVPVGIVYITDGAASHPAHPHHGPADIAQLRQAEAVRAMQQLRVGPTSLYFLGAPDGTLSHLDAAETEKFASRLAVLLAPLQPTELFIPCQDDSSSEHSAAYQLTLRALRIAGLSPRLYEYPVWARWRPQHLLRLGLRSHRVWRLFFPQNVLRKRAALACYQSQTQPTPPWPQPVLPSGFAACFESAEEFFFER